MLALAIYGYSPCDGVTLGKRGEQVLSNLAHWLLPMGTITVATLDLTPNGY